METFTAGAWRQINRGEIYVGGQWRRLTRGEMYVGGQWRTIFSFIPAMSVSLPSSIEASAGVGGPVVITTSSVTATPTGGQPGYSYSWAMVSGSGITITSPSFATTQFSSLVPAATTRSGVARVTVTDSRGTSASADISVTLYNVDIS